MRSAGVRTVANDVGSDRPAAQSIKVTLGGVAETVLWPLYSRAAFASGPRAILQDPRAIGIVNAIDYPFARHFRRPSKAHALRAASFDDEVRRFLSEHPDGTVVALGEGLETGFWRVDNGRVRWLSVDLPEVIDLRARWLPDTERHRNLACSVLDARWMDEVDRSRGVFLTAAGLLMYFEPSDVEALLAACAGRFLGSEIMFDVIPRWLSDKTVRGRQLTRHYRTPPMPWGLDAAERGMLRAIHPNIVDVRDVDVRRRRSFALIMALLCRLPVPTLGVVGWPPFVVVRFGGMHAAIDSIV